MNHTQLLNHLIAKHNLKSYCEIGIKNPANNYLKINCEDKEGCDPDPNAKVAGIFTLTSDQYFNHFPEYIHKDLFFIDGLHHSGQVERDFNNSLKCLNDGGYVVIHDALPKEEITTCVPRGSQKIWHGDVYKFVMKLHTIPGIDFITYDFDEGCTVIWKDPTKKGSKKKVVTTWENYKLNGRKLMRVTDKLP